jgi:hypothetical protein
MRWVGYVTSIREMRKFVGVSVDDTKHKNQSRETM